MLVTSIFSVPHKLFHIILYQGLLNSGLFSTGLKNGRLIAKNWLRSPESFRRTGEVSLQSLQYCTLKSMKRYFSPVLRLILLRCLLEDVRVSPGTLLKFPRWIVCQKQNRRHKWSFKNELKATPFIRQIFIDNDDGKPSSIVYFFDEQTEYWKMLFQMGMSLEWIERLLVSEEKNFKDFAFFFSVLLLWVMGVIFNSTFL